MRQIFLALIFASGLAAQCTQTGNLTTVSAGPSLDNTTDHCTTWTLNIRTNGPVGNYSAILQMDFGSGFVNEGSACTTLTNCNTTIGGNPNSIRVNLTAFSSTGTASISYSISGASPAPPNACPSGQVVTSVDFVNMTVTCGAGGGGSPTGAAGGDLSGTYPNPGVAKVNGNTPGNTCTNQFTRSINSSAVGTCATVTNSDLTSPTITVNSTSCTLGGSCTISAGTTVTVATPYITVGSTKYVGATLWPFTAFPSGSFLDANTCTNTAGANGSELMSCALNNVNAWYSVSASTSVEAEFLGGSITTGVATQVSVTGIWMCDSTNGKVYTIDLVAGTYTVGTAQNDTYLQTSSWTLAGCSGTPSAGAVRVGVVPIPSSWVTHFKLVKSGGNLLFQISFDGGQTFSQLDSVAVGTLTKGGYQIRATGNYNPLLTALSTLIN